MNEKSLLELSFGRLKGLFIAVGIFSIFANLLMLTGPLFMLQVYDRVLASRSVETLTALFILITGLFLIYGILEFARGRVLARAGAKLQSFLGPRIDTISFNTYQRGKISSHQAPEELAALKKSISSPAPFVFMDLPWTPLFIAMMFVFHPWLGYCGLIGGLIMICMTVVNQISSKKGLQTANSLDHHAAVLSRQAVSNAELVQALGMKEAITNRINDARARATLKDLSANDRTGGFGAASKSMRFYLQSSILAVGAYLAINGEVTPGAMIAASILMGRALAPVEQGIAQWPMILRGLSAYNNLKSLINQYPAERSRTIQSRPGASLDVRNLTLTIPNTDKLSLISVGFDLAPGEVLGVLGKSASGKSSLTKALSNIWKPTTGSIKLGGIDLFQFPSETLGEYIGYLPQDVTLLPGTVSENIARMKSDVPPEQIILAAKNAGAHEMIVGLPDGYETIVGEGGAQLSGGQRQRIGLARALFGNPVLIVLDEPNSHLDNDGEAALVTAVQKLKDQNKTVVIATHRPNVISVCDKILVLEKGKVSTFGLRDEIIGAIKPVRQLEKPKPMITRNPDTVRKIARLKAL